MNGKSNHAHLTAVLCWISSAAFFVGIFDDGVTTLLRILFAFVGVLLVVLGFDAWTSA